MEKQKNFVFVQKSWNFVEKKKKKFFYSKKFEVSLKKNKKNFFIQISWNFIEKFFFCFGFYLKKN